MSKPDDKKLKEIAQKVIREAGLADDERFGSVIAILMMISIILTVIRVLQECNKTKISQLSNAQDRFAIYGENIRTFSKNKGWFTKMRIKKIIRRELSPDDYAAYSARLVNALLNIGEDLKDDEVVTLVEAANV
ncbi:hypothetical protein EB001_14860 [bacterium]|nr:hypothetical protein [bacterium]